MSPYLNLNQLFTNTHHFLQKNPSRDRYIEALILSTRAIWVVAATSHSEQLFRTSRGFGLFFSVIRVYLFQVSLEFLGTRVGAMHYPTSWGWPPSNTHPPQPDHISAAQHCQNVVIKDGEEDKRSTNPLEGCNQQLSAPLLSNWRVCDRWLTRRLSNAHNLHEK